MTDLLDTSVAGGPTGPNRPSGRVAMPGPLPAVPDDQGLDHPVRGDAGEATAVLEASTSVALRVLLATLSATAAVIHFAMVPSHAAESALEGIGFAIAGWFQLVVALVVAARPTKWALRSIIPVNLVLIGVWALSRTAGLPFGTHAGHAELATFIDLTCIAFESVLVLGATLALVRPGIGASVKGSRLAAFSVVPISVVALATGALASPSARDHSALSHGDATATAGAPSAGGSPTADHNMSAPDHDMSHANAGSPAPTADAQGRPTDDKGLALLMNGHHHNTGVVAVDADTQAKLDAQLALTKPIYEKYPTVAAAEADGYRRQGPFAPGLGAHYAKGYNPNADGVMDPSDIATPMLIFDGTKPDSKIAGFMYMVYSETEPEGFIGPNDHWHYHTNVCITRAANGGIDSPFGADADVTQEDCAAIGGSLIAFTGYMLHVWTVPGYESDRGVFSDLNPKITCADGTYYMVPPKEIGSKDSACKDA